MITDVVILLPSLIVDELDIYPVIVLLEFNVHRVKIGISLEGEEVCCIVEWFCL